MSQGAVRTRLQEFRMVVMLVVAAVVGTAVVGVGFAFAGGDEPPTVACPTVADRLPAIPLGAGDEVARDLLALENQIAEADARLASSQGEGGPAFVDNAILGPLAAKRVATLERIEIAIGRHAERPTGLQALATCTLAGSGAGGGQVDPPAAAAPEAPAPEAPAPEAPDAEQPGDAGDEVAPPASGAPTVSCPSVVDQLPAVPDQAADDVARELLALENQIAAANDRLATSQGQGGPAFVDNAVLGPLAARRVATLERIEIAIGRHAERPTGLQALANCSAG